MQEFATMTAEEKAMVLGNMTEDAQYGIKDSRDNKTYCVAKLKDGNIWMTQNLDHDIVTTTNYYTNQNTDIGYNTSTGEYDAITWTAPSATLTDANKSNWNWVGSHTTPMSYDPGDLYWNGVETDGHDWYAYAEGCPIDGPATGSAICESLNPFSTYTSSTGESQYHLGNYYNWTAAVAMSDSSSHTTRNELIEQSICPAGWTLPRSGDGDDTFYRLYEEYNFLYNSFVDTNGNYKHDDGEDAAWLYPLYSVASGSYSFKGHYSFVGGNSIFWTSVVQRDTAAHGAGVFTAGDFAEIPAISGRDAGWPVRCIARPVASTLSGLY